MKNTGNFSSEIDEGLARANRMLKRQKRVRSIAVILLTLFIFVISVISMAGYKLIPDYQRATKTHFAQLTAEEISQKNFTSTANAVIGTSQAESSRATVTAQAYNDAITATSEAREILLTANAKAKASTATATGQACFEVIKISLNPSWKRVFCKTSHLDDSIIEYSMGSFFVQDFYASATLQQVGNSNPNTCYRLIFQDGDDQYDFQACAWYSSIYHRSSLLGINTLFTTGRQKTRLIETISILAHDNLFEFYVNDRLEKEIKIKNSGTGQIELRINNLYDEPLQLESVKFILVTP